MAASLEMPSDSTASPLARPSSLPAAGSRDSATPARHSAIGERVAAGKALRDTVGRAAQGHWKRPDGRPDPIQLLQAGDEGRVPELVPIRYGRMLASPFAFFRGAAAIMAADLAATPATGLRVQACGDCHLMNFGGFATPERNIIFDINDFDETLPAPWEWDIKRLAASFVLAARSLGLSDGRAKDAAMTCARSYRRRLAEFAEMHPLEVWYMRVTAEDFMAPLAPSQRARVQARINKASRRPGSETDFPVLAGMVGGELSIRDTPPLIFHPDAAREPDFRERVGRILAAYRETLPADRRALLDHYQVVDLAMKVVGVGSVGRRCWIILLMSASNQPLFLQAKEAAASVLEPYAGKSEYAHPGQRVVMGQRLSQPASDVFLGWATGEAGTAYYLRQLRDAKIKPLVETFDTEMLLLYAKACGWVLARAHAKAGGAAGLAGYLGAGDAFDKAMGEFGLAYADQAERDHAALKAAVGRGDIEAYLE
ncbi:DUF2252 domain-containing protein [Phenylobacterium sp. LjRoot219]|uniref:DUF2252 domain-containing protein n=1 Tax=Phenylobacterium sp. LjRoot219 TaxID=3342283 RepID=UPI003ECD2D4C